MTLSPETERHLIHTRQVECRGYARNDGLWDIEGTLVDLKTYPFENSWRGLVEVGSPVHEMTIRITVDDRLNIIEAEALLGTVPMKFVLLHPGASNASRGFELKAAG